MHIPDGVLSPQVCAVTGLLSAGAIGWSLHKLKDSLADRMIPMTGMTAALIFAGQMVNFPLGVAPVSGHLMGGVLAAAILGPWAGCLAVSLVLIVQCALFADGGLLALGANIFNMAVIGSWGGYAVAVGVRRMMGSNDRGTVVGVVAAAWLTVMAAAAVFCLELWLSPQAAGYNFGNIVTLMVLFHSAIGVGEALITGVVIGFVLAQRPDLLALREDTAGATTRLGRGLAAGMICALAVAAFLAPFASGHSDGLEAVSERTQFGELQTAPTVLALEDYAVPSPVAAWQEAPLWQRVSVSLAGLLGTIAVFLIALVLGRALKPLAATPGTGHAS